MRLFVFDLDGTLLNTLEDLCKSCNYALEACGLPVHELSEYRYFVGSGVRNMILRALPEDRRNDEVADQVEKFFMPYYNEHKCDKTAPYEGMVELLHALKEAGVKIAVATNKFQAGAEGVMEQYFSEVGFDLVLGQIPTRAIKPCPDIVFDAVKFFGADIGDVVYIGDSDVDMKTGINAGVKTIGVTWGFRTEEELRQYNPWMIAHSPEDILRII